AGVGATGRRGGGQYLKPGRTQNGEGQRGIAARAVGDGHRVISGAKAFRVGRALPGAWLGRPEVGGYPGRTAGEARRGAAVAIRSAGGVLHVKGGHQGRRGGDGEGDHRIATGGIGDGDGIADGAEAGGRGRALPRAGRWRPGEAEAGEVAADGRGGIAGIGAGGGRGGQGHIDRRGLRDGEEQRGIASAAGNEHFVITGAQVRHGRAAAGGGGRPRIGERAGAADGDQVDGAITGTGATGVRDGGGH